jgi:hypothetical protein
MILHNLKLLLPAVLFLFTSCGKSKPQKPKDAQTWFDYTKSVILEQAETKMDNTTYTFTDDQSVEHIQLGKHEIMRRIYNKKDTSMVWGRDWNAIFYFSTNGDFEYRQEICKDGTLLFEGIVYKGEFYGLSTWRYCDTKKLMMQGVRYKNQKIGIWKSWDKDGNLSETNYNKLELLDSMPLINKEERFLGF